MDTKKQAWNLELIDHDRIDAIKNFTPPKFVVFYFVRNAKYCIMSTTDIFSEK